MPPPSSTRSSRSTAVTLFAPSRLASKVKKPKLQPRSTTVFPAKSTLRKSSRPWGSKGSVPTITGEYLSS